MTTVTSLPVSLVGNQTVITTVNSTPTNILGNPLPNGRHMIRVINGNNSDFMGSADFLFVQDNPANIFAQSVGWFLTDTGNTSWNLAYNGTIFTFTYSDNLFYIQSDQEFNNLIIREFLIPGSYAGTNIYGIDNIQAANPAVNSAITIKSPIIFTPTGSNAINFGQKTVSQTTSITTPVTINSPSGVITTVSADTASGSASSFTVNNTSISSTSVVLATLCNYSGTTLNPGISVSSIDDDSFTVNITNYDASPLDGVCKIAFLSC